ncbi:MAG: response regulator, partial [Clostridiales bacterium]|nr:response regulator [Clostridiales bacterium]
MELDNNMVEKKTWKILIVDDDADVQLVTRLVLEDFSYLDMKVELLQAVTSEEGFILARSNPDIAVAIIDVVMETNVSGLELVGRIRNELGNRLVRIILRTGQPGVAPEKDVVIKYDINDYKEKAELTFQKLQTSVITAIRSYNDLVTIDNS